jgi:hypothetical protein
MEMAVEKSMYQLTDRFTLSLEYELIPQLIKLKMIIVQIYYPSVKLL